MSDKIQLRIKDLMLGKREEWKESSEVTQVLHRAGIKVDEEGQIDSKSLYSALQRYVEMLERHDLRGDTPSSGMVFAWSGMIADLKIEAIRKLLELGFEDMGPPDGENAKSVLHRLRSLSRPDEVRLIAVHGASNYNNSKQVTFHIKHSENENVRWYLLCIKKDSKIMLLSRSEVCDMITKKNRYGEDSKFITLGEKRVPSYLLDEKRLAAFRDDTPTSEDQIQES